MSKIPEGTAAWIAAGAAVAIIPVTIAIGIWSAGQMQSSPTSTVAAASESATVSVSPSAGSARPADKAQPSCLGVDGSATACSSADAMLVMRASRCDAEAATQALGVDPREIELQIDVRSISGTCVAALTASAKAAGAKTSDLAVLPGAPLKSALLTCWTDLDPATAVPCSQVHRYEPVTAWRSLENQRQIEEDCQTAARVYVAGPVDLPNAQLSTRWVITSEQQPRYRCLVASSKVLNATVYRVGGRPLPVA